MVPSEDDHRAETLEPDVSKAGFCRLAESRHRIRQFLHFSEEAARSKGIEPQQHQLLLAIKGLAKGTRPTNTALSQQLCRRHPSTVELVNCLVDQGALSRRHGGQEISVLHGEELRNSSPALSESLQAVPHRSGRGSGRLA